MKLRDIAYWVATIPAALLFMVPGGALVAGIPHFVTDMAALGYPGYFSMLLGACKIAGATTILLPGLPRLKEWAYAGMMIDVIGAVVSRALVDGGALVVAVPIGIGGLVFASWALRPNGRTLVVPQRHAAGI